MDVNYEYVPGRLIFSNFHKEKEQYPEIRGHKMSLKCHLRKFICTNEESKMSFGKVS